MFLPFRTLKTLTILILLLRSNTTPFHDPNFNPSIPETISQNYQSPNSKRAPVPVTAGRYRSESVRKSPGTCNFTDTKSTVPKVKRQPERNRENERERGKSFGMSLYVSPVARLHVYVRIHIYTHADRRIYAATGGELLALLTVCHYR